MEFVERNVAGTVVYAMGYARVVALLGPRQAGKSTLARKLAAEPCSSVSFSSGCASPGT
ncbi:MAG TPA: hypothetical protein VIJ66_02865 [Solirubrobacteraceae bacterium]